MTIMLSEDIGKASFYSDVNFQFKKGGKGLNICHRYCVCPFVTYYNIRLYIQTIFVIYPPYLKYMVKQINNIQDTCTSLFKLSFHNKIICKFGI